jgi:hypothetical protein
MAEPRNYPTERGRLSSRNLHQTDNKTSASPSSSPAHLIFALDGSRINE